jgi:peptidoglycan/xylan/chitin deacetylase (PgdA/CDA1 family)
MFDLALYKTPALVQKLFSSFHWTVNTTEKEIYLTFDDGPIPDLTTNILSILDDFGAKATFFCVGENIKKHPEIFKELISKGHAIGNHTFNHLKAWHTKNEVYLENVERCHTEISKFTSLQTKLFRPPYGQMSPYIAKKIWKSGFEIVMWDVLSKDYNLALSSEQILQNSIQNTGNGSIIVFHDNIKSKDKILEFLPLYLKHFYDIGYKFKKL